VRILQQPFLAFRHMVMNLLASTDKTNSAQFRTDKTITKAIFTKTAITHVAITTALLGTMAFRTAAAAPSATPLSATPLSASPLTTSPLTASQLAQFDHDFRQQLAEAKVPGAAYAVVYQNKIIKLGSYGVRQVGHNAPVNADTVFRLASVSKTFTGNLLVLLSQQGRVDLNAPLKRYVPTLTLANRALEQSVTVGQILSQGSGFWAHAFEDLIEANQTPAQILPRLAELKPVCAPGRCYSYQNVFFGLLAQVAEQAGGQPFENQVKSMIFQPLGMRTASYGLSALLASQNKAMPHQRAGKGWRAITPKANFYRFAAAAGVNASARDLAQYLIAMLGQQPQTFSRRTLQQLQQTKVRLPQRPRHELWQSYRQVQAFYGLGWRIVQYDGEQLFYHGGVVDGYRPYIGYSPSTGYGLVVLTNAEANVMSDITASFWQHVLPGARSLAARKTAARRTSAP
jgi:beta-lactamase class C